MSRHDPIAGFPVARSTGSPPLVAHVIHALRVGGLENGLVNLINHMDPARYRHAIVCMTDYSDFRDRIRTPGVEVVALHKQELTRWQIYARLFRLFRDWRPAIVHGRNWDGLDAVLPARVAGVPVRVQGEHGRDMHDLHGTNRRQQWLRRLNRPFTTHYSTVSRDLARYLCDAVGIPENRVTQIYNGVDTQLFRPAEGGRARLPDGIPAEPGHFVVGTVGRLAPVKDQAMLIRACSRLVRAGAVGAERLRLVIVGDGPLRADLERTAAEECLAGRVFFPGARANVQDWLRAFDLFVLPSLAEGISNTVLEAMATGLPIVATDVGGNADLVEHGRSGCVVASGNAESMAASISRYLENPDLARGEGAAARERAERCFSIRAMVDGYAALYDRLLQQAGRCAVQPAIHSRLT
jgi:sugar transferase (PEP-CTERM/EpsH1 system associated)